MCLRTHTWRSRRNLAPLLILSLFKYQYRKITNIFAEDDDLLFTALFLRASQKSTIITSNLTFERRDEIFGDTTITNTIVDRLTYKAYLIDMEGDSYRLREILWNNETDCETAAKCPLKLLTSALILTFSSHFNPFIMKKLWWLYSTEIADVLFQIYILLF